MGCYLLLEARGCECVYGCGGELWLRLAARVVVAIVEGRNMIWKHSDINFCNDVFHFQSKRVLYVSTGRAGVCSVGFISDP